MSSIEDKILNLTKSLYPTGRAFKMPFNGIFEKLHKGLLISEQQAWLDATGILNSILPDNDNFSEEDALYWEERLGLTIADGVSLEDRRAAILRKVNHPSDKVERENYLFIQEQLQLAGFRVWVYENRFSDGAGGYFAKFLSRFLDEYYDPEYLSTFQHGDQQHGNWNIYEKVVNFITNEEDAAVDIVNGHQTFFIGGDVPGRYANIKSEREREFRRLILKLKPVESAALLAVQYGDGLFDSLTVFPGVVSNYGKLIKTRESLYFIDVNTHSVKVQDNAGALVPSKEIGAGDFTLLRDMFFYKGKMYAAQGAVAPGSEIRVYDIATQTELPGEYFGSAELTQPFAIYVYKDEAYVSDIIDGQIHVFDIITGALVRSFGSSSIFGEPRYIAIYDEVLYIGCFDNVLSPIDYGIAAYTLDGDFITEKSLLKTEITDPQQIVIENGYLYVADYLNNKIRVFDLINGVIEGTNLDLNANAVQYLSISKNQLFWTSGGNSCGIYTKNS